MINNKLKNFAKNLFTILGATIIGLILCEIILRVAGISYPVFRTYDELRGFAARPNKEGWWRVEGEAYIRINKLGYRDVEHSIDKPPDTFRVAVLGDSFAEALQVALEDTFWRYLEKNLNTCPALADQKVEVLNFGSGGYGTTQEFLTLQHHVWQFKPDLVLLAVFTGNDITDNLKKQNNFRLRPFHVFENGELVLDNSFSQFGWNFLWKYILHEGVHYSKLLEVFNQARRMKDGKKTEIGEVGLTLGIFSPPKTAKLKEAWLITEALFSQINLEVREQGAIFVLATVTNGIQVYPDPAVREKHRMILGVEDLFYPERRIRSIGEKHGFSVITMAERLQRVATQEGIFLHGFKNTVMGVGHWNETGHRLAGEILVKELCAKVLTPASE